MINLKKKLRFIKLKAALIALRDIKKDPAVKGTALEIDIQSVIVQLKQKALEKINNLWPKG